MSGASNLIRIRKAAVRAATATAVVVTTVIASLVGAAGPAHASGTTDYVLINTGRIDLGLISDPFNDFEFIRPGAQLRWQADSAAGTYEPYLFGVMSMKNASGFCGKITLGAFRFDGSQFGWSESAPLCPNSNTRAFGTGDPGLSHGIAQSEFHRVRISALIQFYPGGPWIVQAYQDVYPYE